MEDELYYDDQEVAVEDVPTEDITTDAVPPDTVVDGTMDPITTSDGTLYEVGDGTYVMVDADGNYWQGSMDGGEPTLLFSNDTDFVTIAKTLLDKGLTTIDKLAAAFKAAGVSPGQIAAAFGNDERFAELMDLVQQDVSIEGIGQWSWKDDDLEYTWDPEMGTFVDTAIATGTGLMGGLQGQPGTPETTTLTRTPVEEQIKSLYQTVGGTADQATIDWWKSRFDSGEVTLQNFDSKFKEYLTYEKENNPQWDWNNLFTNLDSYLSGGTTWKPLGKTSTTTPGTPGTTTWFDAALNEATNHYTNIGSSLLDTSQVTGLMKDLRSQVNKYDFSKEVSSLSDLAMMLTGKAEEAANMDTSKLYDLLMQKANQGLFPQQQAAYNQSTIGRSTVFQQQQAEEMFKAQNLYDIEAQLAAYKAPAELTGMWTQAINPLTTSMGNLVGAEGQWKSGIASSVANLGNTYSSMGQTNANIRSQAAADLAKVWGINLDTIKLGNDTLNATTNLINATTSAGQLATGQPITAQVGAAGAVAASDLDRLIADGIANGIEGL